MFRDDNLEQLKKRLAEEKNSTDYEYDDNALQQVDFETYFDNNITDQHMRTMSLEFDPLKQELKIQVIKDSTNNGINLNSVVRYNMHESKYESFCKDVLKIDCKRLYNDSSNVIFKGIPARIFAITTPYKKQPLVVISTAKQPPEKIASLSKSDEIKLMKVLRGNFLIAGKSGAGKTYLLNYLLSKYTPKTERIGIIQEFAEIYPPNEYTETITTPPRTPGQKWNDLEFITEQSNLMRYDRVLVGEIKSSEAWPFVVNCASGTKGGATIHGDSCQKALQRLKTLCLLAHSNLNEQSVNTFIKDAIDYVVYVDNGQVQDIVEVRLNNNGIFSLSPVKSPIEQE